MKTITDHTRRHLQRLIDAGVIAWAVAIELFDADEAFYLTNDAAGFWHNGVWWDPYPIKISDIGDGRDGELPSTTLTIWNGTGVVMPYLEDRSWETAKITATLVLLPAADNDLGHRYVFYAHGATATREAVSFRLGPARYLDRPFPPDRYVRSERFPGIRRNPN